MTVDIFLIMLPLIVGYNIYEANQKHKVHMALLRVPLFIMTLYHLDCINDLASARQLNQDVIRKLRDQYKFPRTSNHPTLYEDFFWG